MIPGGPGAADGLAVKLRASLGILAIAVLAVVTSTTACVQQTIVLNDDVRDASPDTLAAKDAAGTPDVTSPPADAGCVSRGQTWYSQRAARVLLALDRSATMQEPFTTTTRAGAVQDVLNAEIWPKQRHIQFGLIQFPTDGGPGGGSCAGANCCAGAVTTDANIISSSINCTSGGGRGTSCSYPGPDSPSHAALDVAKGHFDAMWKGPERHVLLFTASEPTCTGQDAKGACDLVRRATNDLVTGGARVHVFFVGDKPGCLADLAQIGSTAVHTPDTTYDLHNQVEGVLSSAAKAACTLVLASYQPLPPVDATAYEAVLGGRDRDEALQEGGWTLSNNRTTITLGEQACRQFLASSYDDVRLTYPTCAP